MRILKIQLFMLFCVTAMSFIFYIYMDQFPAHMFRISASSGEAPYLYYMLTSTFAFVGYYIGPWIFLPFLSLSLLYSFVFCKRSNTFDSTLVLPILFLWGGSLYFLFPDFLGPGLVIAIKKFIPAFNLLLLSGLSLIIILTSSFGRASARALVRILAWLSKGAIHLLSALYCAVKLPFKREFKLKDISLKAVFSHLNLKVSDSLRGEDENRDVELQYAGDEALSEVDPEEGAVKGKVIPFFKGSKKKEKKRSKTKAQETDQFKSQELIDCIAIDRNMKGNANPDRAYFDDITKCIEEKLAEFKISGQITHVLKGPVVDTFELELGPGIKVSRVTSIAEDLSLALYGAPIRIVYPLRGRTTVGIEVPRNPREIIYLDEVLNTSEFKGTRYKLPLAMGKDAFGESFVVDLASMPHMLIAGATGAGKSVFLNALLVSLLVKFSPEKLKLILIDPKQLELALYADLPHLILPVMTDPKQSATALLWACQEMERRYTILRQMGVRNIEGFNEKIRHASEENLEKIARFYNEGDSYELPYLVIIVDEFADLILTKNGKDIENNICRLAAKARAAGIHLIIATQRPSVDVITGLIKSNFPTRVSFRVTSNIDSRTILNAVGAEKLLGKGDMLYKHGIEMKRLHSSYVEEQEIESLVAKLAELPSSYDETALEFVENNGDEATDYGSSERRSDEEDPLYDEAVKVVREQRAASASMLQRRLKIGYNRAANLVEAMETRGLVGPGQGAKPRKVLL